MPESFINFFLSLVAGAIGWWIITLVIGPWQEFLILRRKIHETLIRFGNIHTNWGNDAPNHPFREEWTNAQAEFRQLGCQLNALYESLWSWHYKWEKIRGYDISEAHGSLIGISNSDGDMATLRDDSIRRGLKIKRVIDDATQTHLKRRCGIIPPKSII